MTTRLQVAEHLKYLASFDYDCKDPSDVFPEDVTAGASFEVMNRVTGRTFYVTVHSADDMDAEGL